MKVSVTRPTPDDWNHHLVVDLKKACTCLSSAIIGGGFSRSSYIVNRSVPKGWECHDPVADMERYLKDLGLEPQTCVGLLTGVSVLETQRIKQTQADWCTEAFVTAGTSNAAAAGGKFPLAEVSAGTINTIVLVEGCLSPAAMVNAVQTATEAKTAALQRSRVKTRFGEVATGTTTDTVTIVSLASEPQTNYAGLATVPGYLIAQTVYRATEKALEEK